MNNSDSDSSRTGAVTVTNRPGTVTVTNRPGTVTVTLIKSGTVTVTPEASLTLNIAQVRLLNGHCHCHLFRSTKLAAS